MFNTPPALNPILQPNITLEKANKIARTVYVGNLNTTITEKELMDFFSVCGPISYAKVSFSKCINISFNNDNIKILIFL